MRKHLQIKIYGEVQGVGFRFFARDRANKLGLAGFIRNESDGSVYAEAEGEEKDLEKFLDWCKKGPPFAKTKRTEPVFSEATGNYSGFEIE